MSESLSLHEFLTTDDDIMPPAKTNTWQQFKSACKTTSKYTIGNRRLRMYLLAVFKIVVISFVQANDLLGITTGHLVQGETDVQFALKISSYIAMICIPLLFTFRYIREIIAVRNKQQLTIWINWIESILFFIFVVYSFATGIIHFVYLGREFEYNAKKRIKDPSYFANKSASLEEHLAVEILEVLVQWYVIFEKATHYTHANHSVSIFLTNPTAIGLEHVGGDDHSNSYANSSYKLVSNNEELDEQ